MAKNQQPNNDGPTARGLTKIADAIRAHTKEADPTAEKELTQAKWGNWIQAGVLVLTAFALFFAFGAYQQGQATVKLSKDQVDIAQRQLVASTRAWVGAIEGKLVRPIQAGQFAVFQFSIKNTGGSPALRITNEQVAGALPKDRPFKPVYDGPNMASVVGNVSSMTTLMPDAGHFILAQTSGPLTPEIIQKMQTGDLILRAWAHSDYTDTFGESHSSHYCLVVTRTLSLSWCDIYNDAN